MEKQPNAQTDKYARIMIYAAWIIFLIILTQLFNGYFERRDNPNQNFSYNADGNRVEVKLQQNAQGHYVVPGRINGYPVTFLLDTGATLVSVPETVANQIGLPKRGRYRVSTANGDTEVFGTRLDSINLGPIEMHDVSASITPNMYGDQVLLGMNFMRHLELIQRDGLLILRQYR